MGYFDEQQRIVDYVTRDGMIIELTQNKDNLTNMLYLHLNLYLYFELYLLPFYFPFYILLI